MKVTFLEAKMALAKQFGVWDDVQQKLVDKAYPKAANFKTHTFEYFNLEEFHTFLSSAASQWFALLKGEPQRELEDFSDRKGLTDRSTKTNLIVLDVDGLEMDIELPAKLTSTDVAHAAEWLIEKLPSEFRTASYVALASSNFGRKPGLRMHLYFVSNTPVAPDVLRGLITSLNFDVKYIEDSLTLTPSGRQLKFPIDPCMADNSRIVYIAPPIFNDVTDNPFRDNKDRIALVKKKNPTLDITPLVWNFNAEKLNKAKEKRLKAVMAANGLEYVKAKTITINHRGTSVRVIQNPESVSMEIAEVSDQFVRYNVNGGDSNAYWVWMDNPDIVYSFKPDELPFSFKKADPEAYEAHIEAFQKEIQRASARENSDGIKVVPMVVLDRMQNAVVTLEYEPEADVVHRVAVNSKDNALNWLSDMGLMPPDPIPTFELVFEPTSELGLDSKKRVINTYAPPALTRSMPAFDGDPVEFGDADEWMTAHTPFIKTIIDNMVGNDALCFESFINWFAYLVKYRKKPETAWIFHGVEGTGKGLFIKAIAKPIIGRDYVVDKKLSDVADDQFNGYMETALLMFIDEFNMNSGTKSVVRTANALKNLITEPVINIRKMQTNPMQRMTHFGIIFASNDIDSARISATDRRYNVAPRQETPLKAVVTDINTRREYYDDLLKEEVPRFASMLHSYVCDEGRVKSAIENEAKVLAMEAGMTTDEAFFGAIKNGDLEFFEQLAVGRLSTADPEKLHEAAIARKIVEGFFGAFLIGQENKIQVSDVRVLFEIMTGFRNVNPINFGRKLKQFGMPAKKIRLKEGLFYGVTTRWKHPDENFIREFMESKVDTSQRVVPIGGKS